MNPLHLTGAKLGQSLKSCPYRAVLPFDNTCSTLEKITKLVETQIVWTVLFFTKSRVGFTKHFSQIKTNIFYLLGTMFVIYIIEKSRSIYTSIYDVNRNRNRKLILTKPKKKLVYHFAAIIKVYLEPNSHAVIPYHTGFIIIISCINLIK